MIVGAGIMMFCTQPEWLGNALHWAGDAVVKQEKMELPDVTTGE